jgi:hypothetical protein
LTAEVRISYALRRCSGRVQEKAWHMCYIGIKRPGLGTAQRDDCLSNGYNLSNLPAHPTTMCLRLQLNKPMLSLVVLFVQIYMLVRVTVRVLVHQQRRDPNDSLHDCSFDALSLTVPFIRISYTLSPLHAALKSSFPSLLPAPSSILAPLALCALMFSLASFCSSF